MELNFHLIFGSLKDSADT